MLKEIEVVQAKARSGRAATTGFELSYAEYSEKFGKSARTVKRWVAIGKEQGDPCPLDDPGQMRGWWSRCMKLRCPDGILAAEVEGITKEVVDEVAPYVAVELETAERGLAGALARLEQLEVMLAGKADQPGQVKPWLDAIARMAPLAERIRKEMEAQGLLAPKVEVAQELRDLLQPVESGIRGMYETFCDSLELRRSAALEGEWLKQCDKLFERFGREVFSDV